MVRVLQVVTHMNRGGLETMLMNYYRHMDRSQVQFDFLVHRQEKAAYDEEIELLGGTIYRMPVLNPFGKHYKNELNRFFEEHAEYKVVHVHQDCMSSVILKVAEKQGVPVRVAHSHCASQDKNLKYLIKMYYRKQISKYATHLMACGTEAGKWMFSGADFEVLNNAIDSLAYRFDGSQRKIMRMQLGVEDDTLLVGNVGRFNYQKNHTFLVDIFKNICEKQKAKLLLVGDGTLRSEIEQKVKDANLEEQVIFTGVRSDVSELLQAMDVFVFPSNYEGLPVTMIEAQAAGLPCVISDKVSIECKKTDLVQQIPLSAGANAWAETIIKGQAKKRRDTSEEIKKSGFDIQENAKRLQQFYMRAHEGEKDICLY